MIKIPQDILTTEELERISGMKEQDINIEIPRVYLEKESLTLVVGVKLNFVIPRIHEKRMRDRILKKVGQAKDVRFRYAYQASEAPAVKKASDKSKGSKKPNVSGGVLYGTYISGEPIPIEEIYGKVGERGQVVIRGELFSLDSRAIKNGKLLVTMEITDKERATCCKAFMKTEDFELLEENVSLGDWLKISGNVEFDTFENEVGIMARSINQSSKPERKDEHPGEKRVELHVHTKMSDNDGFNEIAELVDQAAAWGQKAVAITDHGVVQAFPDAANRAAKLRGKGKDIKIIYGMEGYLYPDEDALLPDGTIDIKKNRTYHIILLAKNLTGLRNLYKMVSYSHVDYFYKKPRLPRSVLQEHREGIIVGSACEAGELYQAINRGASREELLQIADFYDYLEIQPLDNNQFMIDKGMVASRKELADNNLLILSLADELGKMTVATTDSHYPTKESAIYRNIIMSSMGFSETNANSLYLRTTDEMLAEFSYLGDRAEEVVITNTNRIADMCEVFEPVPPDKCPPKIEGAEEFLRDTCYENAKAMYGDPIPEVIQTRLDTELNAIINNGYAVMYVAAMRLVKKSNDDGYLVGSRGSVGSSFAATMAGITEVNPLEPHYICPKCKNLEWLAEEDEAKYDCGFDMPDKVCPKCGTPYEKNGFRIPFATFLGFSGNKEPDIDLNFAGEYQATAHKYVGVIFGEKNIFKAGTVATVADKTAYGYVKHYADESPKKLSKYDIDYLTKGCTGVKRTTGQHPGGIIVVPDDHEIYEFCPVQRPANKPVDIITTHFDYHKIDKNLLKLDILGHDVPQMIRHLQNMTGVDPMTIDVADKKVISLFTSTEALNIQNPDYKFVHGTYAIPEFGTNFTRQMLDDIQPTTISALVKISGFSHGTDVWTNNGQELLRDGKATIDELISCRDDIMNYLILKGIPNEEAFWIMEHVRKNKPLTEEELETMKSHGVPDWYIWSCETLKYMFPRAHAVAYVLMSIRMAWFKVYYPAEFYAAWLSSKIDDFDVLAARDGIQAVEREMKNLEQLGNQMTTKQKDHLTVYEVMYEMFSRGLQFRMPELGVSQPCDFIVEGGDVVVPYMAISGLGKAAAESLADAYDGTPFTSLDDVRQQTKLSQSNIDDLKAVGMFQGVPDTAQVSIFELF